MNDNIVQKVGQLFFTTMSHKLYDFGLYRFITTYFWKYKTEEILDSYRKNVSNNHLEIGVGTGFLIKHSIPPNDEFNLTIMDLNRACLRKSGVRLSAYNPKQIQQNILAPFNELNEKFDSVGMNYVIHCVKGDSASKALIFDHVHGALTKGGTFFGATLLARGVQRNLASKLLMRLLNVLCIFSNEDDSLDDLSYFLKEKFSDVQITVKGSAMVWKAIK